jgi:hypothetical protein
MSGPINVSRLRGPTSRRHASRIGRRVRSEVRQARPEVPAGLGGERAGCSAPPPRPQLALTFNILLLREPRDPTGPVRGGERAPQTRAIDIRPNAEMRERPRTGGQPGDRNEERTRWGTEEFGGPKALGRPARGRHELEIIPPNVPLDEIFRRSAVPGGGSDIGPAVGGLRHETREGSRLDPRNVPRHDEHRALGRALEGPGDCPRGPRAPAVPPIDQESNPVGEQRRELAATVYRRGRHQSRRCNRGDPRDDPRERALPVD